LSRDTNVCANRWPELDLIAARRRFSASPTLPGALWNA